MGLKQKIREELRRAWSESDTEMIMAIIEPLVSEHFEKLQKLLDNRPKIHRNSALRKNNIVNALINDYEEVFVKLKKALKP